MEIEIERDSNLNFHGLLSKIFFISQNFSHKNFHLIRMVLGVLKFLFFQHEKKLYQEISNGLFSSPT